VGARVRNGRRSGAAEGKGWVCHPVPSGDDRGRSRYPLVRQSPVIMRIMVDVQGGDLGSSSVAVDPDR